MADDPNNAPANEPPAEPPKEDTPPADTPPAGTPSDQPPAEPQTTDQKLEFLSQVLNDVASTVYKGEMVGEMSSEYPDVPKAVIEKATSKEQAVELAKVYQDEMKKVRQSAKEEAEKAGQSPGPMSAEDAKSRLDKLAGSGNFAEFLSLHARQRGVQLERANQ